MLKFVALQTFTHNSWPIHPRVLDVWHCILAIRLMEQMCLYFYKCLNPHGLQDTYMQPLLSFLFFFSNSTNLLLFKCCDHVNCIYNDQSRPQFCTDLSGFTIHEKCFVNLIYVFSLPGKIVSVLSFQHLRSCAAERSIGAENSDVCDKALSRCGLNC